MQKRFLAGMLVGLLLLAACGGSGAAMDDTAVSPAAPDANGNPAMEADAPALGSQPMMGSGEMGDGAVAEEEEGEAEGETAVAGPEAERAIALLAAQTDVAAHLANYPDWSGEAWPEEDDALWSVDLYSEAADEWLGWGLVNLETGDVMEYFVPRELSAEEFQAGLTEVEALVFNDAEVRARLGDPAQWEHETNYNRWEGMWEIWFWRGLDEIGVMVHRSEEGAWLEAIVDGNALEAAEQAALQRNQAIELAYEAPAVDEALAGIDDWHTYVSDEGNGRWLVQFAGGEELLFYALVDVEAWQIIESGQ